MKHLRYRASGMLARMRWSALWSRCSINRMSRLASRAARRMLFQRAASETGWEQELTTKNPSGFNSFKPKRLMSKHPANAPVRHVCYGRRPEDRGSLVIKLGGPRHAPLHRSWGTGVRRSARLRFLFNPNAAATRHSGRPCLFWGSALALRRSRRS